LGAARADVGSRSKGQINVKNRTAHFSPQYCARVAGVLYLFIIAAGLFAEAFVRGRLIVPADAAATAANILAHQMLFRLGIAADLSTFICAIAVTVILYALLKPVNENLALLMLLFNLAQDAIGGMNCLNTYESLQVLGSGDYLKVFSPEQLQAMALLALKAHSVGFDIALIFFGLSCIALGYLIFNSGFLPKVLGILMTIAGACYFTNSLMLILFPSRASILLLLPAAISELALALWLTAKGVNVRKWEELSA
jgi:hypothetical protein